MPELPEVERVRQTLEPHLVGRLVLTARLIRRDIWTPAKRTRGSAADQLLEGARIDRLERRGKQLAVITEDERVLLVHLGMTGQFCFRAREKPLHATHIHARWQIGEGTSVAKARPIGELTFRDPRRFGGLWSLASVEQLRERWAELGPDGLTITTDELVGNLARSKRPIKAGLLDQAVVAGVGNIYADEALFRARIHPLRLCTTLDPEEWDLLTRSVREVLREAVAAGGSTLRDYVDADGRAGGARDTHRVYGRGGEPCYVCGRPLHFRTIAQRTSVFCAFCQPRQRPARRGAPQFSTSRFPAVKQGRPRGRRAGG